MFDTSPKPILPRFTAVILTALETEYKAVRDLLVETKVIVGPSGRDYREGRFHRRPDGTGDHAPWRVLIHEGGRDQMNALRATEGFCMGLVPACNPVRRGSWRSSR